MESKYIREKLKMLAKFLNMNEVTPENQENIRVNVRGAEGFHLQHDGKKWIVAENG